jgi:hypothetical protein
MCWSVTATVAMVGIGAVATGVTLRQGRPPAIPLALGYFTVMEALQLGGYMVLDQCASPVNQSLTWLSMLHITFQPFVINAFAMELVPQAVRTRMRAVVFGLCALASAVMLMQWYPFEWAGPCLPGTVLCGPEVCTRTGTWHIAWDFPYNGLLRPLTEGWPVLSAFPTYTLAVFVLPLVYGAWRLVLFHALAGPVLASLLTGDPGEMPAIWCLFSIGLVLMSLSPRIWRAFEARPAPAT